MHPIEQNVLSFSSPAPFGFGQHPEFGRRFKASWAKTHKIKKGSPQKLDELVFGKEVSLSDIADSRHPKVFVIPRDRFLSVVDAWDDVIGFERTIFPFSSTDFYVDIDEKGLFNELCRSEPFSRLGGISQLGYLVPPRPEGWDKNVNIAYIRPTFVHNRWIHSLLVTILTEVILARNGFSREERAPVVLTAGSHDIAIPAGGDSVKRVDPKNLNEEKNFSWVLKQHGLAKYWTKQFGFNLSLAKKWVKGEGLFGRLLDAIDKISYTALDCYWIGFERPCQIRNFCLENPLVMDVWQDISFTPDKTDFAFSNPERLFKFLLLRAYEHQELLLNPYCRALDLFLKRLVEPLYQAGIITREQLLAWDDQQLEDVLARFYPQELKFFIEPEELSCKKFTTTLKSRKFCLKLGKRLDHAEYISGFSTCLDWPVWKKNWLTWKKKMVPLREAISQGKVKLLEEIAASTRGYYVYYRP